MKSPLLKDIERFIKSHQVSPYRFGILAASNGRLVDRLRSGGRVWPETEKRIREYIKSNQPARGH